MAIDFEFLEEFDRKQVMIVDDDAFMLGVLEKLLNLQSIGDRASPSGRKWPVGAKLVRCARCRSQVRKTPNA